MKLRYNFPKTIDEANEFNGLLKDNLCFLKFFPLKTTLEECFNEVNKFLDINGYEPHDILEFMPELSSTYDCTTIYADPYVNETNRQLVLVINKESNNINEIDRLTKIIVEFRDKRDWKQFHNSKDLAIALAIESNELLEAFLWKSPEMANRNSIREELADVFTYALLLANEEGLDVSEIVRTKLRSNKLKYPIDKAKGKATKYTEL